MQSFIAETGPRIRGNLNTLLTDKEFDTLFQIIASDSRIT